MVRSRLDGSDTSAYTKTGAAGRAAKMVHGNGMATKKRRALASSAVLRDVSHGCFDSEA
jgi:hypothetical protein